MSLQNVNSYTYTPGFTQGQYHNAVICISGNVQSLYLNGNLVGSTSTANNILSYYPNINQILLGCAGDKSNGFTGYLDDFRMYNYAFNSSQVSNLYSNRNLIAYYPFDTSLNTTTANHSTLTYDATLVGGNTLITTSDKTYKVGTGGLSLTNTAGITSTSYVNSTCGFSNTATNNLSISIWFQTSAISGRTMRLIDLCPAVGTPGIFIDISGTNGINTLYNNIPIVQGNLLLHWPFDTNMNESVNGYTATLYGTTSPAISNSIFKVGTGSLNCSSATGTISYVSYTNANGILPISNTYTFSFWYYPTRTSINYSHLFNFCNSGGNDDIDLLFNLGTLDLYLGIRSGTSSIYSSAGLQVLSGLSLTANIWNHVALSITSTSSNVSFSLWINNVKLTYTRASSQGIPQVARRFAYINGATSNDSTPTYVDDFRVYTTLLTDAEVTALYNTR